MNNSITFILPGKPHAKQRSRKGVHGNWYNPQDEIMSSVSRSMRDQFPYPVIPQHTPVKCTVFAFFSIPKTKKEADYCLNSLDCDNILKFYMDCMNKTVFHDDNQVYSMACEKSYSHDPRTEVEIEW